MDEILKKQRKLIIKYSIWLAVILIVFILTLANGNRINVFANVFSSISNMHGIIITIYFITLILSLVFTATILFILIMIKLMNLNWTDKLIKLDKAIDIPYFVIKTLSLFLFFMINIVTPCTVSGDSMNPTFESGEKVLCVNTIIDVKRGDIVVFDAYNYTGKNSFYIKRVAAASFDEISYKNEHVYVNGIEEYLVDYDDFCIIASSVGLEASEDLIIKIPRGKLLVLGDNREDSLDSRFFGLIDSKDVFGRVFLRFLPFNKISIY